MRKKASRRGPCSAGRGPGGEGADRPETVRSAGRAIRLRPLLRFRSSGDASTHQHEGDQSGAFAGSDRSNSSSHRRKVAKQRAWRVLEAGFRGGNVPCKKTADPIVSLELRFSSEITVLSLLEGPKSGVYCDETMSYCGPTRTGSQRIVLPTTVDLPLSRPPLVYAVTAKYQVAALRFSIIWLVWPALVMLVT